MYQRHELFSNLSPEDITATLKACTLTEKEEYIEEEADRFRECRLLIEQGKTYKQAAAHFRQQDKTQQPQAGVEAEAHPLDISELLALASQKCGTRIKLSEATGFLAACGLPDQEQYTREECDRFLEGCELIKNQGKSHVEVAAQFGIATTTQTGGNQEAAALLQEVNELLSQASSIQMQQIREILPQLAVEQLAEIKSMFWRMTAQRLRQHMKSGDMESEIRTASSAILNGSGNGFGLLNQGWLSSPKPRSLPGSSTSASINE